MQVTFSGHTLTAKAVHGGKEMYQGARREYLDFVFEAESVDFGELDTLFTSGTDEITLADEQTGEIYTHTGYVGRGPIRLYPLETGGREIAARQYRKTEAEERAEMAMQQAENIVAVVPVLAAQQVATSNGDAGTMRVMAGSLASVASFLPARNWEVNMKTKPGDIVWDKEHRYAYVFTGTEEKIHSNPLFFPGSTGVYYWAIIPEMYEGVKVYPDVSGIIVAVLRDEFWWNSDKTKKFRWNNADNKACNWYPGQAGVHAWVAV